MSNFHGEAIQWRDSLKRACDARGIVTVLKPEGTLLVDLSGVLGHKRYNETVNVGLMVGFNYEREVIRLVCMPMTTPGDDGLAAVEAQDLSSPWVQAINAAAEHGVDWQMNTLSDGLQMINFCTEIPGSELQSDPYPVLERFCAGVAAAAAVLPSSSGSHSSNTGGESSSSGSKSSGCYVATAVYGSYDCPQVRVLRRWRDFKLSRSGPGRAFIHAYYAVSPRLVCAVGERRWFATPMRRVLDLLVKRLHDSGLSDVPYFDQGIE